VTKRIQRRRRKKPVASNERSNILNQIKRKAQEKKNVVSPVGRTAIDNNNNTKESKSVDTVDRTRKCQFQFSDDDDVDGNDNNDDINNDYKTNDGDTTESYDVDNTEDAHTTNKSVAIKHEIKQERDDNDEDENEDESSPSKTHTGRKNIRKIIDDQLLDVQTKQAVDAELERRRRIAEKQKEYNDSLLEQTSCSLVNDKQTDKTNNNRLVLELDSTSNEPLIEVSSKLVQQLKPHQCDGIRFLWNNVFESIDAIQNKKHAGNGCILAHCMGLGKTLQVISFLHTILNYDRITNVRKCLVLCPINAGMDR
jgi:SNF2 family DNA or RNA helicase